ncbi:MAG: Gfo/Idh/MocA family oxidoreductase [Lachnospiraceae bacterium]|nr:Gfo/Idh/MocA family oxidoreductase [Lachnospiraceae bacterium]
MKKITFAILGMGNRGTNYGSRLAAMEDAEITAIADVRPIRRDSALRLFLKDLPPERVFSSGEEMLKQPKLADIMIICSQDQQHRAHAVAAMEKGYDLILEKPIAANLEDCKAVLEAAHKYGRRIIVCHVLRYTVFYQYLKKLIADGTLGKVESIEATEMVGYHHFCHSFVRGNWHNSETSSPMILAKSCHDLDLFLWLTGQSCKKVSSFGSLDYFKAENCPPGAAERCIDCTLEDCPANALNYYYSRLPGWPANVLHPEPTKEIVYEILKTSDYGRCVFKMDNNVVDHEVTNLLLEDGCTVNFTMTAFTGLTDRRIHVFGTKGDISGEMHDNKFRLRIYGKPDEEIDLSPLATDKSGHGGGDGRMLEDVIRLYRGDDFDSSSITVIDRSTESHFVAFAAEQSRLHDGETVDMKEFLK